MMLISGSPQELSPSNQSSQPAINKTTQDQRGEFHIHNVGPYDILVTVWADDLGADEGWYIAPGEKEVYNHVGSLYVRCPQAQDSSGNRNEVRFLVLSGAS
jgi:hypothetical protein